MKEFLDKIMGNLSKQPLPLIVALAASALLVVHMLRPDELRIDSITLGLLAIILISPYLRFITRIRFGQVEVDIDRRQVEELEKKALAVPRPDEKLIGARVSDLPDTLAQIAESDPPLAVVRLAIEVENRLRDLADVASISEKGKAHSRAGIRQLSHFLLKKNVIDRSVFDAISVLADIRNRVLHGGRIEEAYAMRVLDSGGALLRHLEFLFAEEIVKPTEREEITREQNEEASRGLYKVVTIVPYVENPEKRTYVLSQEQLDTLLEGYEEYAEYLVSIEKVEEVSESER